MSRWREHLAELPPVEAEFIRSQVDEIRDLGARWSAEPELAPLITATFGRLAKTAGIFACEELEELASVCLEQAQRGEVGAALDRLLGVDVAPVSGALRPIVVLAPESMRQELEEQSELCAELVEIVTGVPALHEAARAHNAGTVIMPGEALDELANLPSDSRRETWLYQPGAAVDLEARNRAVHQGVAGFVPWPLLLTSSLERIRTPREDGGEVPYRLLVLEGGKADRIARAVDLAPVDVTVVQKREEVLSALHRNGCELLALDLDAHAGYGLSLFQALKSHETLHTVDSLALCSRGGFAAHATKAGLDHFIRTPIAPAGLRGRVLAGLRDVRSRRARAEFDVVTGLLNRAPFLRRADWCLARARREGEQLAGAIVDIDGLEAINNQNGLGAGDELLRHLADVLRNNLRSTDVLGRVGGDGIGAIMTGCGISKAHELLAQATEEFEAWFRPGSPLAGTQLRIGMADASEGSRGLLYRAEQAQLSAEPGELKVG
jgi:diguanylate cyclase (GGDEF)-like protein